jgi:hypothetical protein
MSHVNRKCPKCHSRQTKIKTYTGNLAYMGLWIHCKRCGVNSPLTTEQSNNGEKKQ